MIDGDGSLVVTGGSHSGQRRKTSGAPAARMRISWAENGPMPGSCWRWSRAWPAGVKGALPRLMIRIG